MTLEEAAQALNQFKHDDRDDWYVRGDLVEQEHGDDYVHFTEFEVIAIAEKYLREAL